MPDTLPRIHYSVTRRRYETRCPDCGSTEWDFTTDRTRATLANHRKYRCPENGRRTA